MLIIYGLLIAIALIIILFVLIATQIHPFLAVTSPIAAEVLVVEGWIPDYAIKQALAEFESGSYKQLVTTGGPLPIGFYLAEYKNFAELAAATLKVLGMPEQMLTVIPVAKVASNRTHASAIALHQWLADANFQPKSINLFTNSVHGRRSWLIFKQVLTPEIPVGIISAATLYYDSTRWWNYSEGVRTVLAEAIAYIYVRFLKLQ